MDFSLLSTKVSMLRDLMDIHLQLVIKNYSIAIGNRY